MRRSFPLILALVLLLIGPTAIAHGEEVETSPDSVRMGAALGLSKSESRARFDWTVEFSIAAGQIADRYPELYADARIIDDSTAGYILFTEKIPDEARRLVEKIPAPIELRTGAPYNEEFLRRELMATFERVWKTPQTLDVTAEMNEERSGLSISVTPAESVQKDEQREYLSEAKRYADASVPVKFSVDETYMPPRRAANYRGGSNLDNLIGERHCTAGFTVRTPAGVHGMSTAGHCAEPGGFRLLIIYNQGLGGANYAKYVERLAVSPHNLDLAWYGREVSDTTTDFLPEFYDGLNVNDHRPVRATANPLVGASVAKFGRVTGYDTDAHVTARDVCAGESPCRRFSITDRDWIATGDSGGPWFWNYTANGITYGWVRNTGGNYRAAFTPVFLLGYMNVGVWVQ